MRTLCKTLLAGALMAASSATWAYVIDANLADWGLARTGSATDWTPRAPVKAWTVEDQTGGLGVYLNPGYGGQAYDAEAMYIDFDSQYLYLALATGHNPATPQGGGRYAAGDFAIDFGRDGSYEFGLETTGSNGNTRGGLYRVAHWGAGLWGAANEGPTSILAGQMLGLADIAHTTTGVNNLGVYRNDLHYFYEARIPVALFGAAWGQAFDVHWTMNCANDSLKLDPAPVPEPATLALLAAGTLGFLRRRPRARG